MKMSFQKQIGNKSYVFEVEGRNLHEVVMESEKLSFPSVSKCGLCESDWLVLKAYVTKEGGYEYTKIACLKCGASLTFGQRKDNKDQFFLRKNEQGKLDWQERQDKVQPKVKPTAPDEDFSTAGEEELPF